MKCLRLVEHNKKRVMVYFNRRCILWENVFNLTNLIILLQEYYNSLISLLTTV